MIRVAFSRRRRRYEETLDHIDTLEVERGIKQARERYHAMPTAQRAAELWKASASRAAANYTAGVSALARPND